MTETDEKPEERKPVKQGLHGWKAALAMFGCGSLAAFTVFGVVASILSVFLNTVSTGVDSEPSSGGVPQEPGSPEEELHPETVNMCEEYLQYIPDINIISEVSTSFEDDRENDESLGSDDLWGVSGECEFMINPTYGASTSWHMNFEFNAVINDPDMDRDDRAMGSYEEKVSSLEGSGEEYDKTEHDWTSNNWPGAATSFYFGEEGSESEYTVVGNTRSAVYVIEFQGDSTQADQGEVPEFDFERQSRDLVNWVDERFGVQIPE